MRSVTTAFSSNVTDDNKELYLKIHGQVATVPANGQHEFLFTIPYDLGVYIQGAEIVTGVTAQVDLSMKHPVAGILEQYGFDVCKGESVYTQTVPYAARVPMGLQVSITCKNIESVDSVMGVNFILHQLREPEL